MALSVDVAICRRARVLVTISAPALCAQTPISTRCYAHTMVRQQPQPVAIRSYVGLGVRLLAIPAKTWTIFTV